MCEVFALLKILGDKLWLNSLNLGAELVFQMSQRSCKSRNSLNEAKSFSVIQRSAMVAGPSLPLEQLYCQPVCLFIHDDNH